MPGARWGWRWRGILAATAYAYPVVGASDPLPGRVRLRPTTRADEEAVERLAQARDVHDCGVSDLTRPVLLRQWGVGSFDPAADARVAADGDTIVGYASSFDEGAIVFVDPAREGEGAGSALRDWVEVRARERGTGTLRQRVAESNAGAHVLLRRSGYGLARSVLLIARGLTERVGVPPAPPGISLRPLDVDKDAEAIHAADHAAFSENADYVPMSLETFRDAHLTTPEVEPGMSRVAWRGERIAGFTVCSRGLRSGGYIDLLAVDASERRQGLGTALLFEAFAAFARAGLQEAWLDVWSDNSRALRLYERAGMTVRVRFSVFEKPTAGASAARA